jgi:hypothetical protein
MIALLEFEHLSQQVPNIELEPAGDTRTQREEVHSDLHIWISPLRGIRANARKKASTDAGIKHPRLFI